MNASGPGGLDAAAPPTRIRFPRVAAFFGLARAGGGLGMAAMPGSRFSRDVENLIADLRGLPRDGSRSKLRETTSAGNLVERLLHKYRIGMATPEEAVRDAWNEIVGEANATFCHPLRIDRDRVLIVGVSNPVVRQELLFHKAVVLERIRAIPACHHIEGVVFRGG